MIDERFQQYVEAGLERNPVVTSNPSEIGE